MKFNTAKFNTVKLNTVKFSAAETQHVKPRMAVRPRMKVRQETLNHLEDLIQANYVGAKGLRQVGDDLSDDNLATFFQDEALARRSHVYELSSLLANCGSKPLPESSWLAAYRRNWIAIKAVLTSDKMNRVLAEIRRADLFLIEKYKLVARSNPGDGVNDLLAGQLASIRQTMAGLNFRD